MALTGTDRGSGNNNVSGTTFTLSPSGNFAAGSMAVIVIATDNAGASGAGFSTFTVTDGLGNTWTRRTSPLYDPGAASAGVEGAIFTTLQNGGTLQSSTVITVTFNNASVAKAWALHEIIPTSNQFSIQYKTGANSVGSATGTPTITTSSINVGDVVIGGGMAESADTWAGDADATNGSWSTHQHAAAGTGATGMSVTSQRKVVTATATQTYNPTLTSADVILSWIQLHEIGIRGYGQTQADIKATSIGSGQAQADIKAVGRGSGQAQASLLVDRYPIAVMADGPISYWRLGEPSGTLAVDMKGNNDGTYENTPILGVTGALVGDADTAITLEGTDQDVDVLDSTSLDFGDIFSIEGWFKRGVIGILQALNDKGATGGTGPLVFFASDNKLRLATSGAGVAVVQSSNSITDLTTWHHFVVTKNGAAASVYIDGIDVSVAQTPATFSNTTNHFRIGRETNASSFFNGSIDEYAVYNYALTPTQVLNHYIAGVDGTNRYGQAQARIKALGVNAFGQSQADIKQTYTVSGQALAFISPFRGYGQANALVNGIFTQVIDTFTRSITDGLGTADDGGNYTLVSGTASNVDVNGTEATIQSSIGADYLTELNNVLLNRETGVSFRYDFKLSLVPDTDLAIITIWAGLGTGNNVNIGWRNGITYFLSTNNIDVTMGLNGSGSSTASFNNPQADTWYTVEALIVKSSDGKRRFKGRIYPRGNIPTAYNGTASVGMAAYPGHVGIRFDGKVSGNTPLISIDNLEIKDAGWTESGQAQSRIKQTYTQLAQAQADIKATSNAFGQANADIKATSNSFGQVQADIKNTYFVLGQTQAQIISYVNQSGQANADILATNNAFGQSGARIKQIYTDKTGQSQAFIIFKQSGLGQVNALVNGIYSTVHDTFTRTVVDGIGTSDDAGTYVRSGGLASNWNVNGSKLTVIVPNNIDQRAILENVLHTESTEFSIDWSLDKLPTTTPVIFDLLGYMGTQSQQSYTAALISIIAGGLIQVGALSGGTGSTSTVGSYIPNDIYRLTVVILKTSAGFANYYAKVKTWKIGTVEPDWEFPIDLPTPVIGHVAINVRGTNDANVPFIWTFDNFKVQSAGWTYSGQAQASILATSNKFAQANAYILGINYNSGQAQTYIAYNYLLDTFTRIVSAGAGTADTGNIWTTPNDPIYVNVDGSKLILNIEDGQYSTISSAPTTQIKGLTGIEYNFEFSILNFPPIDSYPLYNIFHIEHEKTLNDGQIQYYIELRIYEDGLIITLMSSYNSDAIPPQVTVFGHISRLIIPEEILHIQWVTFAEILKSYLIIKADNGDILSVSALENNLTYTAHTPSITYYSSIASPSSVYLDNLEIKGINYTIRFGQAQAYIRAFNVNKSGQSQARVRGDGALIWLKDTFTRTESGTWGTPDIGPTYTYEQNFGNLIVSGGKGAVSTLTNSSEYIYVVSPIFQSDVDYSIDFEFSGNATNDHYLEFGIRADEPIGNFYIDAYIYQLDLTHFELGISDSESLFSSVNIEVSSTTSVPMKLKMRANGNEILLKTWEASLAEPDWQINATTEDLEYGIAWLTINVRDIGGITSYPSVDNWYITEVLDLHPAQAQAFISKSAGYGQAQATIIPQHIYFLDMFTRVIAPTDSDPTSLGQPDVGQYSDFFTDVGNNTAFSSGTRLESDISTDYSYIQTETLINRVNVATFSMDFFADIFDAQSYAEMLLETGASSSIFGAALWVNNSILHLGTETNNSNTAFIPVSGTTYRLKLFISPLEIKGKVWNILDVEPDWMVSVAGEIIDVTRVLWYTQAGDTQGFYPYTIALDNLSIYSPDILPGPAQAQARIAGDGALVWFKDTFTRTIDAATPGTPDIGTYSIAAPHNTNFVIDGSKLILAVSSDELNTNLYAVGNTAAYNTDTSIQFTVPTIFVDVQAILVEIRARDYLVDVSAYIYYDISEGIMYLYVDSGVNSDQIAVGPLQYGVTYNLKLRANNNHAYSKLWTEPNEEPDWMLEVAFVDSPGRFGGGNSYDIDLQQSTLDAVGQINIDNFLVTEVLNLHPGQAQALIEIAATVGCGQAQGTIKHTYFQHGQSQALISGSAAQFGQAQGKIKAIGVNNCGQTQADIKATSIQLGQANVSIKQTYPLCTGEQSGDFVLGEDSLGDIPGDFICIGLFGQAQAAIVVTSKVCGQTQADIKHTYTQSGQAQADIKATSVQFGQAQSDIKQTYVQSGQAQALISITTTVSAQAQGRILQTYNQSGQAQGSIKQSYIICGQSQGQIKNTYQSFGQAQAYILLLQQVYGQSRAEIKSTYNQSANTQARILNTYSNSGNAQSVILTDVNIYAQTQAYIKATSVQNGQAQANIISVNSEVAQAQAQILATSIVTGQAEAFILKSAGYGQARAYVIITIFFGTLEISDSNPINVVLSDEIDVGPTEEDSESFTLVLEDGSFDIILEDSNITIILEDSNY